MIGYLRGRLFYRDEENILVCVNGVGYEIRPSRSLNENLPALNEELDIFIHTYVREDSWVLYGFATREELQSFRLLLKVSGIGPNVALEIVSTLSSSRLYQAIDTEDVNLLCTVNGVGKKTAQRIVFELRGKLPRKEKESEDTPQENELFSALEALGYSRQEAKRAVKSLPQKSGELSELVREALKILHRN